MTGNSLGRLAAAKEELERASTAERVADVLRGLIVEGSLAPGEPLSEGKICAALGISRNTLRESFRLLGHEGLVQHEFGRGVFVLNPTVSDVVELYRVRRVLELAALRDAANATPEALRRIGVAVEEGQRALDAGDPRGVGTANMRFHEAIAALHGSRMIDTLMRQVLARTRLVFHRMAASDELHPPYLPLNREIHELLGQGEGAAAAARLAEYLDLAERQLVARFAKESD